MCAKLSTHVLDTQNGTPAKGVRIELSKVTSNGEEHIVTSITDSDGRTEQPLLSGETIEAGEYLLRFHIGDYFFVTADEAPFLNIVPVQFRINDPNGSYHVPLLATPWSYSTYRGS